MKGRVLVIAGSDSGGGAGIQADIKTITALGGYAATAITALTAQDTQGVHGVQPVPPAFVAAQIACVLEDIGADTVKIGMLADEAVIDAVVKSLQDFAGPIVLDPVMVAKGGAALLEGAATRAIVEKLLPLATLVTPNLPEAEALVDFSVDSLAAMDRAARTLLEKGAGAALIKGGHGAGEEIVDLLVSRGETKAFYGQRIHTRSTHGTGCTLASAVAVSLAQGRSLVESIARARSYVRACLMTAPGFGHGHGPLNHMPWGHKEP
jgi:hydroxymethylpyrimidine/phosphomethylpyrimidine kinase